MAHKTHDAAAAQAALKRHGAGSHWTAFAYASMKGTGRAAGNAP
ncbi:conserved hypothetical protein [delta proteobacterium NaphS2]|nr:conserved hypothetical protein [delta proteobacterium NaphS2]